MINPISKSERQYYLDWIRVITILIVFLFHGARFFDSDDWHLKNTSLTPVADVILFFLKEWMMPIFFFISGASAKYALVNKNAGKFLGERTKRILVPLIFGIFILSPPQVYLERFSHRQFVGSLWAFFPHYFTGFYAFGGNFAWMGLHLWYLLLLFIYSLIALPLLLWWREKSKIIAWPFLMIFGLLVVLLILPGVFIPLDNILSNRSFAGWGMLEYLIIFLTGYFAYSISDVGKATSDKRYLLLSITLTLTGCNLYLYVNHMFYDFGTTLYLFKIALRALVCYSWIFTIIGFAARHLNYSNRFLKYCNEAVLPFYIAHQPIMLLTGYYIIPFQVGIIIKYLLIVATSLTLVMVCYQFLIRKFKGLRCLFGMTPASK